MSDKKIWDQYVAMEKERDALRAKTAEMERQEPVAWRGRGPRDGRIEFSAHKPAPSVMRDFAVTPLYALPGAQPAPSVHEVTDAMALAFHAALTDGSIGDHEMEEIKAGLRAALAAAPEAKP